MAAGGKKKHSPVAFGILGGLLGLILGFVASIPYAGHLQSQDPLLLTEDAYEKAGNVMAPAVAVLIALLAYLGVRWAKKRNQKR